MVTIKINGKDYSVEKGKSLLDVSLALGFDIPHFCFHPALGSVGACRLCAVKKYKDADDQKGRIVMSCMEPVADGLIISTEDEEVKTFRAAVTEGLMTNHPHDCPVCDEGGECHLQDMTVMTGHNYRKFDFKKRTHKNQYLGPFVLHEMNRCIQCYRCVRFYRDYAGGKDLNVFGSHNHVYFGRFEDGTLQSEFSGNLVEVCPTGVFTDKTAHKHFARKWDLSNAPSICTHCSLGCNTIAGERYDSLRRIRNRYNQEVNGYFLCDRGRFGYEFVNSEKRLKQAFIKSQKNNVLAPLAGKEIHDKIKKQLSNSNKIIGIGSPRASLEANYSLLSLTGADNFFHGISEKEYQLTKMALQYQQNSSVRIPTMKQMENADVVLVLGEDLVNTAPRMALAIRQSGRSIINEEAETKRIPEWEDQAVRDLGQLSSSHIYIANPIKDYLDDIAKKSFKGSYSDITALAAVIAKLIDKDAPEPPKHTKAIKELAREMAESLKQAKNPLIVSGISSGDTAVLQAAFNISTALLKNNVNPMLGLVLPESNSMGLALLPGESLQKAFYTAKNESIDTLIILENDLYRREDSMLIDELIQKSNNVIVIDTLENKTTQKADILLAASAFSESAGTLVNNEGRAQRFYKAVFNKNEAVRDSWRWINELKKIHNNNFKGWDNIDSLFYSLTEEIPVFSNLKGKFPDAGYRVLDRKIPRQSIRFSGRTSMYANLSVSEKKLPEDPDSPFAYSMEGFQQNPPSSLVPFYCSPGWNSVQALYKYVEGAKGALKGGNPGVLFLESSSTAQPTYFNIINNEPGKTEKDELVIFPVYQIFGSEELSSEASGVAERIKKPFLLLNSDNITKIKASAGDIAEIEINNIHISLEIVIDNNLKTGVAGISVQLPGMPYLALPAKGKVHIN